jgi:SHS2 domain-containing protein
MKPGYRWLDHTADVGVVARGETLEALFEVAAEALTDLITDRAKVRERLDVGLEIRAPEQEQLLVRWLAEILLKFEIEGLVFHRFSVRRLEADRLEATAFGEAYDPERHSHLTEVKGVTYHHLSVRAVEGGWEATVIFDI